MTNVPEKRAASRTPPIPNPVPKAMARPEQPVLTAHRQPSAAEDGPLHDVIITITPSDDDNGPNFVDQLAVIAEAFYEPGVVEAVLFGLNASELAEFQRAFKKLQGTEDLTGVEVTIEPSDDDDGEDGDEQG